MSEDEVRECGLERGNIQFTQTLQTKFNNKIYVAKRFWILIVKLKELERIWVRALSAHTGRHKSIWDT